MLAQREVRSSLPCSVEVHALDLREEIDSQRGNAELDRLTSDLKISWADPKLTERGAKFCERSNDATRVFLARSHPNINVLRRPGMTMMSDGVASNDEKLRACVEQREEQVDKIRGELSHGGRDASAGSRGYAGATACRSSPRLLG